MDAWLSDFARQLADFSFPGELDPGNELTSELPRSNVSSWLRKVLPNLVDACSGSSAVWVGQQDSRWTVFAATSEIDNVDWDQIQSFDGSGPAPALSPVADEHSRRTLTMAIPQFGDRRSDQANDPTEFLQFCWTVNDPPWFRWTAAIELLAASIGQLRQGGKIARQAVISRSILIAAAHWQTIDDDEELLREIANLTPKLLRCERASIFLWDRKRRKLIAKPATGIDGAFEVPDNVGVVGSVIRDREPKVWANDADDHLQQNSAIDKKTGFQTRSLAAVPMVAPGRDPEKHSQASPPTISDRSLIGVFEAINKSDGQFDESDLRTLSDLSLHAAAAIENQGTRATLTRSRDRLLQTAANSVQLIGNSEPIRRLKTQIDRIAPTDLSVLVRGENGTGKEVLAQQIHYRSDRRHAAFVAVNCAALVESLLESELFGHEKGSFTDASDTRIGKFEAANGGTLFLDEIGDMSLGGQAKLLRVLENHEVVRVGSVQTRSVDVRLIAATNQPLEQAIAEKRFREDLFFRLNVVSLHLPPLRQRDEDVIELAEHFLEQFKIQSGRDDLTLSPSAIASLRSHGWPGNIRQLRNTIQRTCYLADGPQISAVDLALDGPATISGSSAGLNPSQTPSGGSPIATGSPAEPPLETSPELGDATRTFQRSHIQRTIQSAGGNMTEAAARLGLHRSNLYRKMRQLELGNDGNPTNSSVERGIES